MESRLAEAQIGDLHCGPPALWPPLHFLLEKSAFLPQELSNPIKGAFHSHVCLASQGLCRLRRLPRAGGCSSAGINNVGWQPHHPGRDYCPWLAAPGACCPQ